MASILGQFELDFSKLYRQIDLFASDSLIFLAKVAFIKTMSAAIAYFSSSPFFLLAFSFSPFLSLRYCDFELIGTKNNHVKMKLGDNALNNERLSLVITKLPIKK